MDDPQKSLPFLRDGRDFSIPDPVTVIEVALNMSVCIQYIKKFLVSQIPDIDLSKYNNDEDDVSI